MSAEALSSPAPAASVGIETSTPTMSAPSFGTEMSPTNTLGNSISTGDVYVPDLNANLFSGTQELKISSVDTFDKVVPGNLAFTYTETLWQASEKPVIEPMSLAEVTPTEFMLPINTELPLIPELESVLSKSESIDIFQTQEPEVAESKMSESAKDVLDSYLASLGISESRTEELISNKEVVADVEQAAVVKEAWIAIGSSKDDATESAFNALNEKLLKSGIVKSMEDISSPQVISENEKVITKDSATEQSEKVVEEASLSSDGMTKQDRLTVLDQGQIKQEHEKMPGDTEDENLLNNKQDEYAEDSTHEEAKQVQSVELKSQIQEEEITENDEDQVEEPEMIVPNRSGEGFFEEDAKADAARKEIAEKAVEKVSEIASKDRNQKISGAEIAKEMPSNPQPYEVISEIIKESRGNDGSYVEMKKQIADAGEIGTPDTAKKIVGKAIQDNPAVRVTSVKTSRSVTEADVQKVLREEVVLFDKR